MDSMFNVDEASYLTHLRPMAIAKITNPQSPKPIPELVANEKGLFSVSQVLALAGLREFRLKGWTATASVLASRLLAVLDEELIDNSLAAGHYLLVVRQRITDKDPGEEHEEAFALLSDEGAHQKQVELGLEADELGQRWGFADVGHAWRGLKQRIAEMRGECGDPTSLN